MLMKYMLIHRVDEAGVLGAGDRPSCGTRRSSVAATTSPVGASTTLARICIPRSLTAVSSSRTNSGVQDWFSAGSSDGASCMDCRASA